MSRVTQPDSSDLTGLARTARVDVLFTGYAGDRVAGTVVLVRDLDRVIVLDPGMVPSRAAILDPLQALGVAPGDVTDVVLSHHHPDHTVNIALFGEVPVHDFQAVYTRDEWTSRPAEGVALTHLWWTDEGPADDPYAPDREVLRAQRERVLAVADLIVPGHGSAFTPGRSTPR